MVEDVTQAGKLAGPDFRYNSIKHTPSTRLAHKLMAYTQFEGDNMKNSEVYEAIYEAHFTSGQDICDRTVLLDIADRYGLDTAAVRDFMDSDSSNELIMRRIEMSLTNKVSTVPSLLIGATRVDGAQTLESLAAILRSQT